MFEEKRKLSNESDYSCRDILASIGRERQNRKDLAANAGLFCMQFQLRKEQQCILLC